MTSNASVYQLNPDPDFHFQLLRALAVGVYDGSDISEVLTAATPMKPRDFESFSNSFIGVANHVYDRAKAILKNKFPVSARTAFFSAATYFRAADFYLHGNPADPRINDYWELQTEAYNQGLALLGTPNHRVTLNTTSGFEIPAIWYTPDEEVKQRPTLVVGNGYDGSQEEMYHVMGVAALERGYNVLSYEGPGQPTVRRDQDLGFIYDWEKVVTPVMDYVLSLTEAVDPDAVGLLGLSFGGYLAPRAAAFEHRFAAIMAIDGVWDFHAVARAGFGPDLAKLYDAGNKAKFDELAQSILTPATVTMLRWALEQGMWSFNVDSPYDFLAKTTNFTLEHVVHKVRTPVLVGDAQTDAFFTGQPEKLATALGKWGHLKRFADDDFIGSHAGMGSLKQQNQVLLDWFQGILDGKKGCSKKK